MEINTQNSQDNRVRRCRPTVLEALEANKKNMKILLS